VPSASLCFKMSFEELVRLGAPDETLSRLTVIPRVRTEKKSWKHRGTENTEGRQKEADRGALCPLRLCVSKWLLTGLRTTAEKCRPPG
jgi:hypothetical protein